MFESQLVDFFDGDFKKAFKIVIIILVISILVVLILFSGPGPIFIDTGDPEDNKGYYLTVLFGFIAVIAIPVCIVALAILLKEWREERRYQKYLTWKYEIEKMKEKGIKERSLNNNDD